MRGSKVLSYAALAGVLVGLCPGNTTLAWAQGKATQAGKKPAPVSPDPATTEFDQHLQAGKDATNGNRWDTARQEFSKALELKPDSSEAVALLAQAEIATGRNREAVEHLELFLSRPGGNAADRKIAERLLAEARSKLAMVTIVVDKPGAKVSVDGRVLGESPLSGPVPLDSGHRRIEAESSAGSDGVDIDLEPGTTRTVNLVLKAAKPPTAVVQKPPAWRKPVLITGLGLGAVGIGVGVGFIIAAFDKNADAIALGEQIRPWRKTSERLCPPTGVDARCTELEALESRRDTFANVALAGFVVGGVAAVGTLALWLATPTKTSVTTNKEHSILVVPSPNGVFVTGTF